MLSFLFWVPHYHNIFPIITPTKSHLKILHATETDLHASLQQRRGAGPEQGIPGHRSARTPGAEAEQRHMASFLAVLFPGLDERRGAEGPPRGGPAVRPLLATRARGRVGEHRSAWLASGGNPSPPHAHPGHGVPLTHPPTGTLSLHGRKKHTGHIFSCQKVIK